MNDVREKTNEGISWRTLLRGQFVGLQAALEAFPVVLFLDMEFHFSLGKKGNLIAAFVSDILIVFFIGLAVGLLFGVIPQARPYTAFKTWLKQAGHPARVAAIGLGLFASAGVAYVLHLKIAKTFITGFHNKSLSGHMLNIGEYVLLVVVVLLTIGIARLLRPGLSKLEARWRRDDRLGKGWLLVLAGFCLPLAGLGVAIGRSLEPLSPIGARGFLLLIAALIVVFLFAVLVLEIQGRRKKLRLAMALIMLPLLLGHFGYSLVYPMEPAELRKASEAYPSVWLCGGCLRVEDAKPPQRKPTPKSKKKPSKKRSVAPKPKTDK